MQQTTKYQFNLIETSDPFSPEALNENTRTLETQLARVEATVPKFACGTYVGDGTRGRLIELPFSPKMVLVTDGFGYTFSYGTAPYRFGGLALEGLPAGTNCNLVEIVEGGFLASYSSAQNSANTDKGTYRYFAIG